MRNLNSQPFPMNVRLQDKNKTTLPNIQHLEERAERFPTILLILICVDNSDDTVWLMNIRKLLSRFLIILKGDLKGTFGRK